MVKNPMFIAILVQNLLIFLSFFLVIDILVDEIMSQFDELVFVLGEVGLAVDVGGKLDSEVGVLHVQLGVEHRVLERNQDYLTLVRFQYVTGGGETVFFVH
jgi:hypothetical protein